MLPRSYRWFRRRSKLYGAATCVLLEPGPPSRTLGHDRPEKRHSLALEAKAESRQSSGYEKPDKRHSIGPCRPVSAAQLRLARPVVVRPQPEQGGHGDAEETTYFFEGLLMSALGNLTDHVLATIASILDHPDARREPREVEKPESLVPTMADGYTKIGPGPLAAISLKWTVRRGTSGPTNGIPNQQTRCQLVEKSLGIQVMQAGCAVIHGFLQSTSTSERSARLFHSTLDLGWT
jgi:hypothetical protein